MIESIVFKAKSNLLKISNFYGLCGLLFILTACGEGPPDYMAPVDKRFRTTPSARIFFKNIRTYLYQWEQAPNSRTDFYLLRKIAESSPRPILYPVIADVWMQDQAHLLLRSGQYEQLPLPISIQWQSKKDSGQIRLDTLNKSQQYEVAMAIYNAVGTAHKIRIQFPGEEFKALFSAERDQTHFMISLQDYLRLTEY